jgi:hypothetical protein
VYWLRYVRDGEPRVVILDGWSVAHTRMLAAGLEPGVFVTGYRIDRVTAPRLPENVVGRVLTRQEAMVLLVPKKPPASSVTRRFRRSNYVSGKLWRPAG